MNLPAVALVYAGLLAVCGALVGLVKAPRRRALRLLAAGLAAFFAGLLLPQGETRVLLGHTQLDELLPVYQFHELHQVRVRASREQVYTAIRDVTPDEIALFQALTWVRRLGRHGPQNILNAPTGRPLLDTAMRSGFQLLAEDPGREIVLGFVMGPSRPQWGRAKPSPTQFRSLTTPGVAKVAMNFQVTEESPGAYVVTTETRVYATNLAGRQAFAAYWRLIYPGSAWIRRMWLRAIRLRAESEAWQA